MKICILINPRTQILPPNIQVLQNFGDTTIRTTIPDELYVYGEHMMIEGEEEDIKKWISSQSKIWVGRGLPCEEQFHLLEFKKGKLID